MPAASVVVSRGLDRNRNKFVLNKDLIYKQFSKGHKVTLQHVIPESFREKAQETLMSGHFGIKKTMDRYLISFFAWWFIVMCLDFA